MQTTLRLTVAGFALLMLSACTAMLLGSNSSPERNRTQTQTRSTAQVQSDNTISGAIRAQYSQDGDLSDYLIGIRTVSGNVTLTGTVGSYPARDKAVSIANGTSGVKSVDSRIVVNTNL
jgi:osmotically-inducible protein OsmY